MSLQTLANIVAAHAKCAGLSVDIRILRSPGLCLRPELHDEGRPRPGDFVRLPLEGVMIGTTHVITMTDSRGYVLIRLGGRGEGIVMAPGAAGPAACTLENIITDALILIVRGRLKSYSEETLRCDDPGFAPKILPETHVVPVIKKGAAWAGVPLSPPGTPLPVSRRKEEAPSNTRAPAAGFLSPPVGSPAAAPAPAPAAPTAPAPAAPAHGIQRGTATPRAGLDRLGGRS
jgi:hypothetical protein